MAEPSVMDIVLDTLTKHDSKLDKILEQTTKTNGRVNQLEKFSHSPENCELAKSVKEVQGKQSVTNVILTWTLGIVSAIFLFILGQLFHVFSIGG